MPTTTAVILPAATLLGPPTRVVDILATATAAQRVAQVLAATSDSTSAEHPFDRSGVYSAATVASTLQAALDVVTRGGTRAYSTTLQRLLAA